jgi:hypothetical protein
MVPQPTPASSSARFEPRSDRRHDRWPTTLKSRPSGKAGPVAQDELGGLSGYLLGAMHGVPHGETSCVMLPAVLRWNASPTQSLQKEISAALGALDTSAGDAVAALLDDLGLPRRLGDVGVGAEDIPAIAARAAVHPVVRANPRPVRDAADAAEILALAL